MRVSFIAGVLASIALAAPAAAQTVDELVARHVAARGGYEKLKAVQTIKITRTVATQFSNVKVVIYKKRPGLFRAEQTAPGQPMVPRGINADAAWDTIQGKIAQRPAALAAETRDIDADFDGLLVDWKAKGHTVTLEGTEPLTGGDAYTLKVVTKGGAERYVYLDAKTFLERRQAGLIVLPNGRKEKTTLDFSNYRVVDGIPFAFNIDEDRTGPQITQSFATYTEKIELNVPMEDTIFVTPAAPALPGGKYNRP
jgi:outer membrane lipoprotein-sorting protein